MMVISCAVSAFRFFMPEKRMWLRRAIRAQSKYNGLFKVTKKRSDETKRHLVMQHDASGK